MLWTFETQTAKIILPIQANKYKLEVIKFTTSEIIGNNIDKNILLRDIAINVCEVSDAISAFNVLRNNKYVTISVSSGINNLSFLEYAFDSQNNTHKLFLTIGLDTQEFVAVQDAISDMLYHNLTLVFEGEASFDSSVMGDDPNRPSRDDFSQCSPLLFPKGFCVRLE